MDLGKLLVSISESFAYFSDLFVELLGDFSLRLEFCKNFRVRVLYVLQPFLFVVTNLFQVNTIKESTYTGEDNNNLFFNSHWRVLCLFKKLLKAGSAVQLVLGSSIKIGTELRESSNFTELSKFKLHGTSNLFHCLYLSSRSYTGYRKTYVYSRADTLMEELVLKKDLPVGNGNYIGRNVSGYITSLGFNNGQSG
mmetsp:Transcript_25632/g.56090  ORF Transcript_25632/g.56090 Transcript_25632/m.56090 type:complete len:195 (-) Transcript_25632:204-788(-)